MHGNGRAGQLNIASRIDSMELISFRCPSCSQGLKAPADKAGRKVRCTKCGTEFVIPMPQATAEPSPSTINAAPNPAPAPPKEEDAVSYRFRDDAADEAAAKAKVEQAAPKIRAPKIKRRFRLVQEPEQWKK